MSLQHPEPKPLGHLLLFSPKLAPSVASSPVCLALMVWHSATFLLFSLKQSVLTTSTPQSVVDRTPFPDTQAQHAQRPLTANATRCATLVDTMALLLGRLGTVLFWISLMLAQLPVLTIIARQVCPQMRDVVRLGRINWILMSVHIRRSRGRAGRALETRIYRLVLRLAAIRVLTR